MLDENALSQLSEQDRMALKRRAAQRILHQEGDMKGAKNGFVYIALAFFLGAVGIHNFYDGYWKRGAVQFLLSLMAPYMMFTPLLFTSIWAMLELLFVNKGANGVLMTGNHAVIVGLRILAVFTVLMFALSAEWSLPDLDFLIEQEF